MPKPRNHISLRVKLAAALLALGDIPYEDAKGMSADQVLSLYTFDHGILHAIEPIDEFWNLTPRLIMPHRRKSAGDTSAVAKVKRLSEANEAMSRALFRMEPREKPRSRWGSRPFPKGRGFGMKRIKLSSQDGK